MRKTIGMLAMLLAAQLVLAISMSFTGPDLTAQGSDTPLLDLGDRTVDRLTIEGPKAQRVVLARRGEGWVMTGSGDFPADQYKVDGLLERLKGLKRGWAVATTRGARERFKVSDDAFERRVTLARGDETLATLIVGTSPAMRHVHARTSGDDAVYTTRFGVYDAPARPEDWEDKGVLQIPQGEIASIRLGQLTLSRSKEHPAGEARGDEGGKGAAGTVTWSGEGLAPGEKLNQANADALAQKLAVLTIGSVLGREENPDYGLEAPALTFSVERSGGEVIEYRLGKREEENDYVLKVSSRPEYFRLPGYTADALIEAAGRVQLVIAADGAGGDGEAREGAVESTPPGAAGVPEPATSEEGAS